MSRSAAATGGHNRPPAAVPPASGARRQPTPPPGAPRQLPPAHQKNGTTALELLFATMTAFMSLWITAS